METTKPNTITLPNRIDIAMFFDLIKGKIDRRQYEIVTAAMAESVAPAAVDRVLKYSSESHERIAVLRKALCSNE